MSTATQHTEIQRPSSFLQATELTLPKNETANRELDNLKTYERWVALNELELNSLTILVEVEKKKAQLHKEQPDREDPEVKKKYKDLDNAEYTYTTYLNQARFGMSILVRDLTQRNPFDSGVAEFGNKIARKPAGEVMSNIDLRILINEDLKIRQRDQLAIVHTAVYKYDTDEQEILNAEKILLAYKQQVEPKLLSRTDIRASISQASALMLEGKTNDAITVSRNALLPLRSSASSSFDDHIQTFLTACSNQDLLSSSIGMRIPANPLAISNEFLQYSSAIANGDELDESSPYYKIQRDLWDNSIPWTHDNNLSLEADVNIAHILYSSLKRLHYLGEAYHNKVEEIDSSNSTNKDADRKDAFQKLWQLYRQTEFLIGGELEKRLVGEIGSKNLNPDELKKLALFASLSQVADKEEFTKYQNFLLSGERKNNIAHLPSSYRVGSAVLNTLEQNGASLTNDDKALINELSNDPNRLRSYISQMKASNPNISSLHNRMVQECEPYGAILSLINLVPENGPNSPQSKVTDFSNAKTSREDTLNMVYGVCLRLSQLSERLNCGPDQIDALLQNLTDENKNKSNYQELLLYKDRFRDRLISTQDYF